MNQSQKIIKALKKLRDVMKARPQLEQSYFELERLIANANAPLKIMIAGEFSSGKSTFINSLLGAEIADTSGIPTTAIITKFTYGRADKIIVNFKDGTTKNFGAKDFARLTSDKNPDNKNFHAQINFVERQYPAEILRDFTFIDSPGFNVLNLVHEATTQNFLSNADVVLLMVDAEQAIGASEMKFMKNLPERLKPIIVVNKMDTLDEEEDDPETFLRGIKNKINGVARDVVGVSALMALNGKLKNNSAAVAESNINGVIEKINAVVRPNQDALKLAGWLKNFGEFLHHWKICADDFAKRIAAFKNVLPEDYRRYEKAAAEIARAIEEPTRMFYEHARALGGSAEANYFIGVLHKYGILIRQDDYAAKCELTDAAAENIVEAKVILGEYEQAADAGNAEALYRLAVQKKSVEFAKRAAAQDYADAQYWLAGYAATDEGWCELAAENGHALAQFDLAKSYDRGQNDYKSALAWYERALAQGVNVCYEIAQCCLKLRDFARAFEFHSKAAAFGDTDAKIAIAESYYDGRGVRQDRVKAFVLLNSMSDRRAENFISRNYCNGSAENQLLIGEYYLKNKNFYSAIEWYLRAAKQGRQQELFQCYKTAAEQGYEGAYIPLAKCYEEGYGTEPNAELAFKWYEKAAPKNTDAKIAIAESYYDGRGVRQDRVKAFAILLEISHIAPAKELLQKFYYDGPLENKLLVAVAYRKGDGLPKNLNEAIEWYERADTGEALYNAARCYFELGDFWNYYLDLKAAADKNYAAAKTELENLFSSSSLAHIQYQIARGFDEIKDKHEAFIWYLQAAEHGDAIAQFVVGMRYRTGKGVEQSNWKAWRWYGRSIKNGNTAAKPPYDELSQKIFGPFKKFAAAAAIVTLIGFTWGYAISKNKIAYDSSANRTSISTTKEIIPEPPKPKPEPVKVASNNSARNARSDLSLGGVCIDDDVKQMRSVLGNEIFTEPNHDGTSKHYHYNDAYFAVANDSGRIIFMQTKTSKIQTKRGLHQGSSLDDVLNAYGYDYSHFTANGVSYYEYWINSPDKNLKCLLRFAVVNNVVDYIGARVYVPDPPPKSEPAKVANNSARNARSDLSLGGVCIDDGIKQMRSVLGNEIFTEPNHDGTSKHYHYNDAYFAVANDSGRIIFMQTKTSKIQTKRGLHQGSSLDDVLNAYGYDYSHFTANGVSYYEYWINSPDKNLKCLLRFAVKNNVVDYIGARVYFPDPPPKSEPAKVANNSARNARSDLSLGGVCIDDGVKQMRSVLGNEIFTEPNHDGTSKHYHYNDAYFAVANDSGRIIFMQTKTSKIQTKRGLHQGSSLDDVLNAYGYDYSHFTANGVSYYEYWINSPDKNLKCLLRFAVKNNVVDYIGARVYAQ